MTEDEWLACLHPEPLLTYLLRQSGRKHRLLASAFARLVWQYFTDERSQHAVEVAESFSDGHGTPELLRAAGRGARNAILAQRDPISRSIWTISLAVTSSQPWDASRIVGRAVVNVCRHGRDRAAADHPVEADLVRCMFGNPFRPVAVSSAWLTPNVVALASPAYESRRLPSGELDPQRLAVLADALEDAGCDSVDLLAHLRSAGRHVRGCWALDLVLGKT